MRFAWFFFFFWRRKRRNLRSIVDIRRTGRDLNEISCIRIAFCSNIFLSKIVKTRKFKYNIIARVIGWYFTGYSSIGSKIWILIFLSLKWSFLRKSKINPKLTENFPQPPRKPSHPSFHESKIQRSLEGKKASKDKKTVTLPSHPTSNSQSALSPAKERAARQNSSSAARRAEMKEGRGSRKPQPDGWIIEVGSENRPRRWRQWWREKSAKRITRNHNV